MNDKPTIETENLKAVTVSASSLVVAHSTIEQKDLTQEGMQSSLERIDKNTAILPNILKQWPLAEAVKTASKNSSADSEKTKRVMPPRDPVTGRFISRKSLTQQQEKQASDVPFDTKTTRAVETGAAPLQQPLSTPESSPSLPELPVTQMAAPLSKEPGQPEGNKELSKTTAFTSPTESVPTNTAQTQDNSGAQQAQETRRQENRDKSFLDSLKTWATGAAGKGYASLTGKTDELGKNEDLNDAVGTASGGAFYGAAKELAELTGQAKDSTLIQKAGDYGKRGWNWIRGKENEPEPEAQKTSTKGPTRDPETGKFLSKEERKQFEAKAKTSPSVSVNDSDLVDSNEQVAEALADTEKENESRHKELVGAIKGIRAGAGGESGGFLDSLFGGKKKGAKGAGAGAAGKGILSKMGKGARGFSKVAGRVAAPLAALTAGGFKYADIKDDESLSGGQKAAQVGSTATGALGGAAAGAAAGAALGSVVPILGTAVGGLLGAVIGGIGGEKLGDMAGKAISDKMGNDTEAPTTIQEAVKTTPTVQTAAPVVSDSIDGELNPLKATAERIVTKAPEQPQLIPLKPKLTDEQAVPGKQGSSSVIDETKLANAMAKAMDQNNRQASLYPAVVPASGEIQTDFDDATLTLMMLDRI